jgi:hypothetical protein
LLDDLGALKIDDVHVDVLGILDDSILLFIERVDGALALLNILIDREREPVVILRTLVHEAV